MAGGAKTCCAICFILHGTDEFVAIGSFFLEPRLKEHFALGQLQQRMSLHYSLEL